MDEYGTANFRVRRTLGKGIIFVLGFGVFIPIGIVIAVLADATAGIGMVIFGALPQIVIFLLVRSPGSFYQIGVNDVYLKKGLSKRHIPFSDIQAAGVLSTGEARSVLNDYLKPAVQSHRDLDVKGWYQSNKAYGEFTRFCTVPIIQQTTSVGHSRNINRFGTRTSGDFLLLRITDGTELLISPEDTSGFLGRLRSSASIDGTIEIAPEREKTRRVVPAKDRGKKKKWLVYQFGTFVIVAGAAIAVYIAQNPTTSETTAERENEPVAVVVLDEPVPLVTGWLDEHTFRIVAEAQLTNTFLEKAEDRQADLRRLVNFYYPYDIISMFLQYYAKEHELTLSEDDYTVVVQSLIGFISDLSPTYVAEEFSKDNSLIKSVIDVSYEDFQTYVGDLLKASLGGES